MSEKQNTSPSNDELVKALQILDPSLVDDLKKSEGGDNSDDTQKKETEEEEKTEDVLKSEVETLRSQLETKEAELAELGKAAEEAKVVEKSEEEDLKGDPKPEEDEFQKSIADKLGAISTILQAGEESKKSLIDNVELIKSENESLKTKLGEMEELVKAIADSSTGLKSITNTAGINFLEKSNVDDLKSEDGKTILSKSKQKREVEAHLEKAYDSTSDESLQGMYGESLIRFNAGDGGILKSVEDDLMNNHNVRLID